MHPILHTPHAPDVRDDASSPSDPAPPAAPPTAAERLAAEALAALDRGPCSAMTDPGASEYASWLRQLRR